MGDLIKVGKGSLEGMAADFKGTHNNLESRFEDLTGELLRTLPEWGVGTASRSPTTSSSARWTNSSRRCSTRSPRCRRWSSRPLKRPSPQEAGDQGMWAGG